MTADARIAIPVPTSKDFEYNRRSWPMYAAAVREAGGEPVTVDLGLRDGELMLVARGCQGVLLPGSPADVNPDLYGRARIEACAPPDPARDEADRVLLEEAYAAGLPVLGICYGAQSLNVWRGGTLVQDLPRIPVNHEAGGSVAIAHAVTFEQESSFAGLVDAGERSVVGEEVRLPVNSSHHQAIERVGSGLWTVAVSSQDGVIEAVEGVAGSGCPSFVLGVQWHPERSVTISATSRAIFSGFLGAAGVRERELAGRGRLV